MLGQCWCYFDYGFSTKQGLNDEQERSVLKIHCMDAANSHHGIARRNYITLNTSEWVTER